MNYPKLIKDYRKRENLTQEELAFKLGVSFASVNRWENGRYEPTLKIKRLLQSLIKQSKENQ